MPYHDFTTTPHSGNDTDFCLAPVRERPLQFLGLMRCQHCDSDRLQFGGCTIEQGRITSHVSARGKTVTHDHGAERPGCLVRVTVRCDAGHEFDAVTRFIDGAALQSYQRLRSAPVFLSRACRQGGGDR